MTLQERGYLLQDLKRALQLELAKRDAPSGTSDLHERITRLAEQKLQSLGAAYLRGR